MFIFDQFLERRIRQVFHDLIVFMPLRVQIKLFHFQNMIMRYFSGNFCNFFEDDDMLFLHLPDFDRFCLPSEFALTFPYYPVGSFTKFLKYLIMFLKYILSYGFLRFEEVQVGKPCFLICWSHRRNRDLRLEIRIHLNVARANVFVLENY